MLLACAASAQAAAPTIRNISVRGLQIGGATRVVIDGADLLPSPQLLLSIPLKEQTLAPKATVTRVEFEVALPDNAEPGLIHLRVVTPGGVSAPVVCAVDGLPQLPLAAEVASLPVALHGAVSGSSRVQTTFQGKAGQEIVCDVQAQRLGGKLRPVLHLLDSKQQQIAWSLPNLALAGDARVTATLPADGAYTVVVHDLQYAAPTPNFFRLTIGSFAPVDAVFPAAVQRGIEADIALLGPDGEIRTLHVQAASDRQKQVLPAGDGSFAMIHPQLLVSDLPEIVEQATAKPAPAEKPPAKGSPAEGLQQVAAIPVGINGRLSHADEEDRYLLTVTPGETLRFDVYAARLGSPVDAVLRLLGDTGTQLASNDDANGSADPSLEYKVPADVQRLVVAIKDVNGTDDPRAVYRIAVQRQNEIAPDFSLAVEASECHLAAGGRLVLKVLVKRSGYAGPIQLALDPLPGGVKLAGDLIPADADSTLLTLTGLKPTELAAVCRLRGTSMGKEPPLVRMAQLSTHPLITTQPGLAEELAMLVTAPPSVEFSPDWGASSEDARLVLGGSVDLPLGFRHSLGDYGAARFFLLASQQPPLANNRPDPNQALRKDSGDSLEVAVDAKVLKAHDAWVAAEKALNAAEAEYQQLRGVAEKAADQAEGDKPAEQAKQTAAAEALEKAKTQAATAKAEATQALEAAQPQAMFKLLVPPTLAASEYALAFRVELLSRDKKTVVATAYTPVRRLKTLNPLALELAADSPSDVVLDPKQGATVKVAGRVDRRAGFQGDVTVALAQTPPGVTAAPVILKPDKSDFELQLKLPAGFSPTEPTLKLVATGKLDPKSTLLNRSDELPLSLNILPAPAADAASLK